MALARTIAGRKREAEACVLWCQIETWGDRVDSGFASQLSLVIGILVNHLSDIDLHADPGVTGGPSEHGQASSIRPRREYPGVGESSLQFPDRPSIEFVTIRAEPRDVRWRQSHRARGVGSGNGLGPETRRCGRSPEKRLSPRHLGLNQCYVRPARPGAAAEKQRDEDKAETEDRIVFPRELLGSRTWLATARSVSPCRRLPARKALCAAHGDARGVLPPLAPVTGSVVAWGDNTYGQCDVPAELTDATAIAAGDSHSLAVRADGTVVCWGANPVGQTDAPSGLSNVVAVAGGFGHSLALLSGGTVRAWGWDYYGQTDVPLGLKDVIAVSAGGYHNLALKSDGTVVAWGTDSYGQIDVPSGLADVVALAAGGSHSMALVGSGLPSVTRQPFPQRTPVGQTRVLSVAAAGRQPLSFQWYRSGMRIPEAGNAQLVLSDVQPDDAGNYWAEVSNALGTTRSVAARLIVEGLAPVITRQPQNEAVAEGSPAVFSVGAGGTTPLDYQWQFEGINITGATNALLELSHVVHADAGHYGVVVGNAWGTVTSNPALLVVNDSPPSISAQPASQRMVLRGTVVFRVLAMGSAPLSYQWQFNGADIQGATDAQLVVRGVRPADAGTYRVVVSNWVGSVTSGDAGLSIVASLVVAWGDNALGQTDVPAGLTNAAAVAAGYSGSLALNKDGTVTAWGNDSYGQTDVPPGLSNIVAVASGNDHNLALGDDGTVFAWGWNAYGQVDVPPGLSNVIAIAAGGYHSLALTEGGTVSAWGWNVYGQTDVPSGLSNVVAIAAGDFRNAALRNDGVVFDWGIPSGPSPAASDAVAIAAGNCLGLALQDDGHVVGWGCTEVPADLTNIVAISAFDEHALALKDDGSVVAWGADTYGQAEVPAGLTNVIGIAAGTYHSLALLGDGSPSITGHPWNTAASKGSAVTFRTLAAGSPPLSYQWRFDGVDLAGETNASLTIAQVQAAQAGYYQSVITNSFGTAVSRPAALVLLDQVAFDLGAGAIHFTSSGLHLRLIGLSGQAGVVIWASPDLTSWAPILTLDPSSGEFDFIDPSATNLYQRFYRVSAPTGP